MGEFGMKVRRALSITGLKLRKHSPEIMTVVGAAGTVGAAVMACKASISLIQTLDECKERLEEVKSENELNEAITEREKQTAIAKVTAKNAWEIGKLYLPAVGVEVASLALILSAQGIMHKRVSGMAAAYATLESIYNKYRDNVREQFGEAVDRDMRYGIKHEIVEETVVDEEGNEHKVIKDVEVVSDEFISDYSKFFDQSCAAWEKDPENNLMFLKGVQAFCNVQLRTKGYLFLNDVYKQIGLPCTKAGQCVGWIYDEKHPVGDNYIDFGLYNEKNKKAREFINGIEPVILLDFNVDGDILNSPYLNIWRN